MQVNEGMWVVNKTNEINVNGVIVRSVRIGRDDYISLTDIASLKNSTAPKDVVKNWMRSKMTVLFLGLWETINNPEFKGVEFDSFKSRAGENSFTLSPEQWIMATNANLPFEHGEPECRDDSGWYLAAESA